LIRFITENNTLKKVLTRMWVKSFNLIDCEFVFLFLVYLNLWLWQQWILNNKREREVFVWMISFTDLKDCTLMSKEDDEEDSWDISRVTMIWYHIIDKLVQKIIDWSINWFLYLIEVIQLDWSTLLSLSLQLIHSNSHIRKRNERVRQ
jgi:hypothetical protein